MPLQPSSAPRDLRNVSSRQIVLQKSPWRSCRIKIRNNRIGANGFLNQRCALTPDLESILRTQTGKILLQHGVIPGSCPTKAQGISSPGTHEAILMWPCKDGELRWSIMLDWTCR